MRRPLNFFIIAWEKAPQWTCSFTFEYSTATSPSLKCHLWQTLEDFHIVTGFKNVGDHRQRQMSPMFNSLIVIKGHETKWRRRATHRGFQKPGASHIKSSLQIISKSDPNDHVRLLSLCIISILSISASNACPSLSRLTGWWMWEVRGQSGGSGSTALRTSHPSCSWWRSASTTKFWWNQTTRWFIHLRHAAWGPVNWRL